MAKRIYTPKQISPEIARENALSAARATLRYAQLDLTKDEKLFADIHAKGRVLPDGTIAGTDGLTVASLERQIEWKRADLERAQATLAGLESE